MKEVLDGIDGRVPLFVLFSVSQTVEEDESEIDMETYLRRDASINTLRGLSKGIYCFQRAKVTNVVCVQVT